MLEIYQILSLYKSIQLCMINEKGRILLGQANCLNDIDIDFDKLKRKNENGNGIYFIPSENCNILFLDDLTNPDIVSYQAIIIQTSKEKFQAHILTKTVMTSEQRTKYQRQLVSNYNCDKGAISGIQARRLPGFLNQKYQDRPVVRVVKNTIFDPDVPVLDVNLVKIDEPAKKIFTNNNHNPASKKTWSDFFFDDLSSADMRYACYLVRKGFSDTEIIEKLRIESPKISERKSGHVEDYLDRTIQKARQFIS
ncbi:MAG: DNA-primase RepB domain-containing protein [bacterium]